MLPVRAQSGKVLFGEKLLAAKLLYGEPDTVRMTIIGDVMLHKRQMEYDFTPFLENIGGLLQEADISVANMEFTLGGKPYSGYPAFSAPDSYARYVSDCGIDVFLTANNHILDKGKTGIERTIKIYRQMEADSVIRYTGIGSDHKDLEARYPLIINCRGIRIALVNFTYGTNVSGGGYEWPKVNRIVKEEISAAIERAKIKKADFVIALPHWGNEYELKHSKAQENLARWLVEEHGVHAIVGGHPHVIQDSCVIGNSHVFYSIGNAVSNMSAPGTQLELAVTLSFTRDLNGDKTMLAPEVTYLWCSLPDKFGDNYMTLPVKEYIGKSHLWKSIHDYDKMITTYERVRKSTGVKDRNE